MARLSRKIKAQQIGRILDKLYPQPAVPLEHHSPFTLLIAVVLSAQSTDKRVNQIAPQLFALADTAAKMAELPLRTIERAIRPCGLARNKARAISGLSQMLLEKHNGRVPQTFEELEALPGVGHKTASVLMCQAFGKPAFPVDTHIHRLAFRWGLSDGSTVKRTEEDLKRLFAKKKWAKLHLQMIFFGREFCPARGHDPTTCPICSRFGRQKKSGDS